MGDEHAMHGKNNQVPKRNEAAAPHPAWFCFTFQHSVLSPGTVGPTQTSQTKHGRI